MHAAPPVDLGWAHPPALGSFLDSGGTSPTPLARGVSPLDSPFTRATPGGVAALAGGDGLQRQSEAGGVEVPLPAQERRPFDRLRVSGIKTEGAPSADAIATPSNPLPEGEGAAAR